VAGGGVVFVGLGVGFGVLVGVGFGVVVLVGVGFGVVVLVGLGVGVVVLVGVGVGSVVGTVGNGVKPVADLALAPTWTPVTTDTKLMAPIMIWLDFLTRHTPLCVFDLAVFRF
jgi:hypothetical protein